MKNRHALTFPAIVAFASFHLASHAGAQTTRNWNTALTTGSWNSDTNWGGATGATPDSTSENATFGADTVGRTVSLDSSVSINALSITPRTSGFTGQAFTLNATGGSILSLQGGLTINNGNTVTINPAITLLADQTWSGGSDSPSGSANFTNNITGGFQIARSASNTGVFTFTGASNTFSGGFVNSSGTSRIGANAVIGTSITSSALGTGTLTLNGGTVSSNGSTARTIYNSTLIGGNVTLGSTTDTGSLTFQTDAGFTTPTTFNLTSASTGTLRTITVGSVVNVNQAIGETGGGTRQGLVIAGTSTFNLNNQKTFTGDLYAASGASSILNFGTTSTQTGNAIAFGGILQATGSNRLVSGYLGAEGGEVRIDDTTNLTGVGNATSLGLFHNSRISSANATIAGLAGVLDANSSVSYAITAANSTALNQSTLGDGKAGLAVGTTGILAYTGTLSAGSDSAFRVSGGLGTLSLTASTLTGAGKSVIVQSGGTVIASGNQNYDGASTLNGNLTLSGASGALSGTSGITINNSTLAIDNSTNSGSRINDSAGITLNRGVISVTTGASNAVLSETIGGLTFYAGVSIFSLGTTPTTNSRTYTTASIARANGAVALFRGDSFGAATAGGALTGRNAIVVTAAPTGGSLVGGSGSTATNQSIIPWAIGGGSASSNGGTFVTYDPITNSLRNLLTASEFTALSGSAATDNIREVRAPSANTSYSLLGNSISQTANSFILSNSGTTNSAKVTYTLGTGATLTLTSGALQFNQASSGEIVLSGGTIAFGSAPGVVTNTAGSFNTTLSSAITGSGGVSFFATAGQILVNSSNSFSGGVTVGSIGSGSIGISNDNQLGNSGNVVTHAGGTLRYFGTSANSSRAISLQGNVGDNTFDVQNSSNTAVALSGKISGSGRLRVTQSGGGSNTLVLSNTANDYTGGTQVDSGTLQASSDSALGTGSVVVNNAILNFTSAAPIIGALYNTSQTGINAVVNLGNANTSSSALTIGANNDSGIFIGTIAETAAGRGSLIKIGTGTQVVTGANTYTGGTTVTGGTLNVSGSLADTGEVIVNGGTYTVGASDTVGAVTLTSGTINGSGTLTGSSYATNSGTVSASLAGSGALTQSTGTTTLSGANSYTGGTTVSSGTLNVTGSLSTGAVSVTGKLTGSGTIGGATAINSTGIHNAGAIGSTGKQTFSSSLTYAAGSIFEWDLNANADSGSGTRGTDFDAVDGVGALTINATPNSGTIFRIVLGSGVNLANSFWTTNTTRTWNNIFSGFSGTTGGFDNSNLVVTGPSISGIGSFTITGTTLTWSAVPEPTTALAGLLIGAGLLRRRRA